MDLVTTEGLVKVYAGRHVLDGIDLHLQKGESLVIMGPSGVGKSVLLKHLIGLIRPDQGTVRIEGRDFWSLDHDEQVLMRRRFGIAFQEGALFDSMSVFDNVAFPLRRYAKLDETAVRQRVMASLRDVRLAITGNESTSELSTGMRRRVGFARAVALDPEILLFDEPTSGLDPVMVTVMSQLIVSLRKRHAATAVTVTHDLTCARTVADRIALLVNGRIVAQAPRDAFFELDHPAVRQFVEGRVEGPLLPPEELTTAARSQP